MKESKMGGGPEVKSSAVQGGALASSKFQISTKKTSGGQKVDGAISHGSKSVHKSTMREGGYHM